MDRHSQPSAQLVPSPARRVADAWSEAGAITRGSSGTLSRMPITIVSGPDWATVATAVATAALALFAVFTTIVAGMAFRKQSQEVTLLRLQLKDQERLNESQAEVLALQAKELAESLEERKLNREQQHRAQATLVFMREDRQWASQVMAYVKNSSKQPIYDVRIIWHIESTECGSYLVERALMPGEERVSNSHNDAPETNNVDDLAAINAVLSFRDAAGTTWKTRPDGIVQEVAPDGMPLPGPAGS